MQINRYEEEEFGENELINFIGSKNNDDEFVIEDELLDVDYSKFTGDFKSSFNNVKSKVKARRKVRKAKPLTQNIGVDRKATIHQFADEKRTTKRVIVPRDREVIIQGVNNFILSDNELNNDIRNIGYYKGEKLKEMSFIFDNTNSALDFNLELFNPSMPLDYTQSTSLNLNDKISVADSEVSYTDLLFNILANPTLIINAKFVFSGASLASQINQGLFFKNKTVEGKQKLAPLQVSQEIDTMQYANNIVFFNLNNKLNRAYVPDGMDVIQYKVLAGMFCTFSFYYKQVSLKKVFFKESRISKDYRI